MVPKKASRAKPNPSVQPSASDAAPSFRAQTPTNDNANNKSSDIIDDEGAREFLKLSEEKPVRKSIVGLAAEKEKQKRQTRRKPSQNIGWGRVESLFTGKSERTRQQEQTGAYHRPVKHNRSKDNKIRQVPNLSLMMESSQRNGDAIHKRIQSRQSLLVTAMTELLDSIIDPATSTDLTSIQARKFRMEMQTQQLIRGCEDLLVLVRQMQELWLFGKLDTVGGSEVERGTEEDVKAMLEVLRGLDGKTTEGNGS